MKRECLFLNKAIGTIIRSEAGGKDDNQWDINTRMHSVQGRQNRMLLLNRYSLSAIIVHTHSIYPCRSKTKKLTKKSLRLYFISKRGTIVKCENLFRRRKKCKLKVESLKMLYKMHKNKILETQNKCNRVTKK